MKSILIRLFVFLVFTFNSFSETYPFRTWTSSSGVRIEARLISKSADKLTIERSDLKQFVFPLSLLSQKDRDYVISALSNNPVNSRWIGWTTYWVE